MTQRKFKHKYLPLVAEKDTDNIYDIYYQDGTKVYEVDECRIENSNDWQEITPELVEGKWYKHCQAIGRYKIKSGYACPILEDAVNIETGELVGEIKCGMCKLIEATPDEIHKALDAIRIGKGLVEGVKMETFGGKTATIDNSRGTTYKEFDDELIIPVTPVPQSRIIYRRGNWASKVSEPILVTMDGFDLYNKGERIWIVDASWYLISGEAGNFENNDNIKTFWLKENARSYIENHKPRFSRAEYEADLEWLKEKMCGAAASIAPYSFNHARFYHELSKLIRQLKSK